MGYTSYSNVSRDNDAYLSTDGRLYKSRSAFLSTASMDSVLPQKRLGTIHNSMSPIGVKFRECRDSETHPISFPVIFGLDVTGSMQGIPHYLLKDGLPKLMEKVTQKGVNDASLLFLAIGDTSCDEYPLQVGQFESGDLELDQWLMNTYPEGGGGANLGESYNLAWYFAAYHTQTDAWDKRKQKGLIITLGDEPCLPKLTTTEIHAHLSETIESDLTSNELLAKAKERYNVYHINIMDGSRAMDARPSWKQLLGNNYIEVQHQEDVANAVADLILKEYKLTNPASISTGRTQSTPENSSDSISEKPEIIL